MSNQENKTQSKTDTSTCSALKLYLIAQDENDDYDTFDSAVVCAKNAEEARNMSPLGEPINWEEAKEDYFHGWCVDAENVKVKYLGLASFTLEKGSVCSSYNAG